MFIISKREHLSPDEGIARAPGAMTRNVRVEEKGAKHFGSSSSVTAGFLRYVQISVARLVVATRDDLKKKLRLDGETDTRRQR